MNNRYLHQLRIFSTLILSAFTLFTSQTYAAKSADWDNDGLSDQVEERIGTEMYLADTDGDGVQDNKEVGDISNPRDTDHDGRIDALDVDDDNDGIPTVIEGAADPDRDGIPSYLDTDSDGDGLADAEEVNLVGNDSNHDGIDDRFDSAVTRGQDENGDGIDDNITLIDTNKNGVPDLLDKKSKQSHARNSVAKKNTNVSINKKTAEKKPEKRIESKPVVVSAAQLPSHVISSEPKPKPKPKPSHQYMVNNKESASKQKSYGGSGYFYCAKNGKIVKGIKGFAMTPPSKVTLLRDASQGDYKWRADGPGTYALQFQIPQGMSIVRGLAKGRRIVKSGDINPLILGARKNPARKGYLDLAAGNSNSWYTSFDLKDNAPLVANNNIPLSGGVCEK